MKWKNFSIHVKILSICGLIIASFIAALILFVLPTIETAIYEIKKEKVRDIVDTTITTLEGMHRDYREGRITEEQFRTGALATVGGIRYGPRGMDYLWINDFTPRMVMHPFRKDLDGKDLSDYKDPRGTPIFIEFARVCKQKGRGYVSYLWQYGDDSKRIEPKISYVRTFEPMGWIVGSGVYETDIRAEIAGRLGELRINLIIVFSIITGVLVLLIFFVSRNIRKNIGMCLSFADDIAEGNLTGRIALDQKDEIGNLAKALNLSADRLEGLITEVINNAERLNTVANQISGGNDNLSQMTSEQASSIEEIASSIEEAMASISSNADSAMEAEKMSRLAIETARDSSSVIISAIDSMGKINESSARIAEITKVINDISFQTNLLALNAAVEAARAGDQGRGFAVVAAEVRNLAQRSAAAAKEIDQMIAHSINTIKDAAGLGNESRDSLDKIMEGINKIGTMIHEIAAASDEQKHGMEQINTAMAQMDTVTQQNASLVEENSSISSEMSRQATEMRDLTGRFVVNQRV